MKYRLLFLLLCLSWQLFAQLTIKVTAVPANTPTGDNIHIAGSFQDWNPSDPDFILTENGDGTWQITINPPVGLIKYKFTRGSWATVEGNANGMFLPDREYNYSGGQESVEVTIQSWEDLGPGGGNNSTAADNVFILDSSFYMPELDRNRRIWIYLPPDYENTSKHYPVLYMHDGQNVFDASTSFAGEWEVDETLNELFDEGDYGCIVVAIDNGGTLRLDEYAPWVNTTYNAGGEGDEYMDFVVTTLKPQVDANYRTLSGRDYTGIMGSSLGALISQFGIMEYQENISKAGIFSPAFWFNPEIYSHSGDTPKTEFMKIYLLAGALEGGGSVVEDANQMEMVLQDNGFGSQELKKVIHADGQHSEWYWAREFGAAYEWLFGDLNLSSASEQEASLPRLYPNPADSILRIKNLPSWRRPFYYIYTADGRLLQSGKLSKDEIDVSSLPSGFFTLQVLSKRKTVFSEKFFVKQ